MDRSRCSYFHNSIEYNCTHIQDQTENEGLVDHEWGRHCENRHATRGNEKCRRCTDEEEWRLGLSRRKKRG